MAKKLQLMTSLSGDGGGDSSEYSLPVATSDALGGVKADPVESTDTQPVRIGDDGKLYTEASSGSTESNLLVVTFTTNDDGTITSSHSAAEINAAVDAGKGVMGVNQDAYQFVLGQFFANAVVFTTTGYVGNVQTLFYMVDDDKNVTAQSNAKLSLPTYTESDYGKVLSATADGLVWVEQTALPDGEEMTF